MSIIPCCQDTALKANIDRFAEILSTECHTLGEHGLDENEFYDSGFFRGVVEVIRGQYIATMREKREFAQTVLNWLQDQNAIQTWLPAGNSNRFDYEATMPSGRIAAIELKGCLDGNNINIVERPPQAHELVIWSICTNAGSDPRKGVWSAVHTRLSAEVISNGKLVDGLVVWDMVCGSLGRACPKLLAQPARLTTVGRYQLPPPCIYTLPDTIPSARSNPEPRARNVEEVEFLNILHQSFGGQPEEVGKVRYAVANRGPETVRQTSVERGGVIVKKSRWTPIRRK